MKKRTNFRNLVPMLAILVAILGFTFTSVPEESDEVQAANCAIYGLYQIDMKSVYIGSCMIFSNGEWHVNADMQNCTAFVGESCRVVGCKTESYCRADLIGPIEN